MTDTTIFVNATVVTVDPDLGVLHNADVLVSDGVIVAVGGNLARPESAEVVDAVGKIIIPGFIDTHRHTWQAALRTIAPNDTFDDYFQSVVGGYALRFTADDVRASTLLGSLDALDSGITTLVDWAHIMNTPDHADADIAALKASGLRSIFAYGFPSTDVGAWNFASVLKHPEDARRVKEQYFSSENQLMTFAMALRGPDFSVEEVVRADWALADELDAPITIHAGVAAYGNTQSPVKQLHDWGLLRNRTTFVHGNALDDGDLRLVRDTGGTISSAPAIEMLMGHGHPAIYSSIQEGLQPSLSIDVVTGSSGDMFSQMRAAFYAARMSASAASWSPTVTVSDVLEWATINGARSVGLDHRIGSITPGKRADLVLIDTSGPGMSPVGDAVGSVVLSANRGDVTDVVVDGKFLKRGGRMVGQDMRKISDEAGLAAEGIARRQREAFQL